MLFFTNPASLGPVGILVFFVTVYITMLGVMATIIRAFMKVVYRKIEADWKEYAYAAVLAFWPVMILFFTSAGVSNMLVSVVGSTIFVALDMFLIKKV